MKKIVALALAFVLAFSAVACSKTEEKPAADSSTKTENTANTEKAELKPVHLTFAAQEVGTAAYNYAAALQTVMLLGLPEGSTIDITTTSPGGVGAPIIVNGAAQCDIVMSNSAPAKWSKEDGILGNAPTSDIACIAGGLGHDFINVMFTQKFVDATGIKTLEDLVAQKYPVKLVIKKDGTLGELSAEKVLAALGVTFDDIRAWGGTVEKTGGDAIKSGLQDDIYDMTIDHLGAGQANTTELCLTHDMYDVQLADSTLAKLVDMGYDYITVEPNTWNRQETAIKTVGSQQCILVPASMDADVVYALTKAVCEHAAELGDTVAAMKYFNPKEAGAITLTGVALHEGAARYYKEVGYKAN